MKRFPIMGSSYRGDDGRMVWVKPTTIPWAVAEIAYAVYRERHGDKQTLERIAERGGFGRDELLDLLRDAET